MGKKYFVLISIALVLGIFFFAVFSNIQNTGEVIKEGEYSGKSYNSSFSVEGIENYKSDLRQIHCYCGCDHTDLYNCYEEGMLTNCGICMGEYKDYLSMKSTKTIQEISAYIDQKYPGMEDDDED